MSPAGGTAFVVNGTWMIFFFQEYIQLLSELLETGPCSLGVERPHCLWVLKQSLQVLKAHKLRTKVMTLLLQCHACSSKKRWLLCIQAKERSESDVSSAVDLAWIAPEGERNEKLKGLIHTLNVPKLLQREMPPHEDIALEKTMLLTPDCWPTTLGWRRVQGTEMHQAAGMPEEGHHQGETSALLWQTLSTAKRPGPIWSCQWKKCTPLASQCCMDPFYKGLPRMFHLHLIRAIVR